MTHSPDTAKEVVHDVFLNLWIRRTVLDTQLDIRVYLNSAVRNRVRNLRKHARVVEGVEAAVEQQILDAPAMSQQEDGADVRIESHEFYEAYRDVLTTLTERDRTALVLRWEEGMTLEQIGKIFGVSIVGARGIVLRAQEKVRKALTKYRR